MSYFIISIVPADNLAAHGLVRHQDICKNNDVNPLRAKYFRRNINMYIYNSIIPPYQYDTGSWNSFPWKKRSYLFYIANIMGGDGLVMEGARASAAMILTQLNWDISVPAGYGLSSDRIYIQDWHRCKYVFMFPEVNSAKQGLTHWGLVMPNGLIDMGQHWFR